MSTVVPRAIILSVGCRGKVMISKATLREKNGVAWILTYAYVIEWPLRAVHRSLERLRGLQSRDERIEASQFSMAIPECPCIAKQASLPPPHPLKLPAVTLKVWIPY